MKIKQILDKQTRDVAIEGVFLALRLLKQQRGISTKKTENSFEIPIKLSAVKVQQVAAQLLNTIEQTEKVQISKLSRQKIFKYVERLSREVERLSTKNVPKNNAKAMSVLKEMRSVKLS